MDRTFWDCALRETTEEFGRHILVDKILQQIVEPATGQARKSIKYSHYNCLLAYWRTFIVQLDFMPELTQWPQKTPDFNWEFFEANWFRSDQLPENVHAGVKWTVFRWGLH